MFDAVDNFIMCETNKADKIVVAILAEALIKQRENTSPEEAAEIFGEVYMELRKKKLISFP